MLMEQNIFKAEIELKDRKIRFEGPKAFVEEMMARYATAGKLQDKPTSAVKAESKRMSGGEFNERELVSAKRPHGHHEMIAVLAFALKESGTAEFTEHDIRSAYIRAGVRPPKVVAQAIRDAKNNFEYVVPAGSRGVYRLSDHGDAVVRFDLPREGAGA
jgi:hypothetical protein